MEIYKMVLITHKSNDYIIYEVNKNGYKAFITNAEDFEINKVKRVYFYNYKNRFNDVMYAFKTFEELEFFKKLLSIRKVGQKIAYKIMKSGWKQMLSYISNGKWEKLVEIPSISKQLALYICNNLKV
ncbi:hypothetical protein VO56_02160 [Mycoplasmopsis gallinacea]|uniref:Holliday junction DNA helicase RuvA n=1 Tax=Mycoplasmopsis gallinacea TaxID=29556 RepID=A0A0D5ZJH8_9BACT|nr:hypothetical protein VO56_02160 [Mycoplasmopsis gallinacea]